MPPVLARERTAGQVARFSIVGVLNTGIDFALLNILFHVFGLPLLLANTISYTAGFTNSFVWNKHWTFSAGKSNRWRREFVIFIMISIAALAINDLGIMALNGIFGGDSVLSINLQKLGASVLSMTWNFIGYRFLAFRHPGASRKASA